MLSTGDSDGAFTVIVSTNKYSYVDDTFPLGLQAYYKGFLELSKGPQVTLTTNFKCAGTGAIKEFYTNEMTINRLKFKIPSASTAKSVFEFGKRGGG